MFLTELNEASRQLDKLQTYLKENFDYEMDMSDMTVDRANAMIEATVKKMNMAESAKEVSRLFMIAESLKLWTQAPIQTELTAYVAENTDDSAVEQAKVIIAAQEMCDSIQKMIEDVAEMQVQDLLPLVDAMKAELGMEQAEAFNSAADSALGGLVDSLKSAKEGMDNAILGAQGQAPASDMMGDDGGLGIDDVDMSAMDDEPMDDDGFGGDEAMTGPEDEPIGREMKEGLDVFDAMLEEIQSKVQDGQVSRKDLEEALAKFRKG